MENALMQQPSHMQHSMMIHLILFLSVINNSANAKDLNLISNFKFGGKDNFDINDYITLANDPKGSLPASFTVCSSLFIKYVITNTNVIEMFKQDGSHWFLLQLSTVYRNYHTQSETMTIWFANPVTGKDGRDDFTETLIPIVPHSWYHVCMGLDTVSGLLRIVVNGVVVVNEEKDYFRNTKQWKPDSLEGKLFIFKSYRSFWYQNRGIISNLNIFSSMMSVEDMVTRTAGGEECSSPGDYIRQDNTLMNIL